MNKTILTKSNIDELNKKLKKHPNKGPGICRVCGCTWDHACSDNRGPCWWINQGHNLCSHCFGDLMEIDVLSDIELEGEVYD